MTKKICLKGGSYDFYPKDCQSAMHLKGLPDWHFDNVGFRLIFIKTKGHTNKIE